MWLLLHFKDLSRLQPEEQDKYLSNEKVNRNIRYIASILKDFLKGYNHSYNKFTKIISNNYLKTAVCNSLKLDTGGPGWPCKLGTQVYKIAEKILELADKLELK